MGLISSFKKGQLGFGLFEIILVVAVLFMVGVAWVVTNNIGGELMDNLLDDPDFLTTNESRAGVESINDRSPKFFNGAFGLLFLGFFLLGIISAWNAPTSPIFLIVVFLMIIIVLILPVFLGDAWVEINDDFSGDEITFMNFVLSNYVLVSVVFTMLVLLVMFSRYKWG